MKYDLNFHVLKFKINGNEKYKLSAKTKKGEALPLSKVDNASPFGCRVIGAPKASKYPTHCVCFLRNRNKQTERKKEFLFSFAKRKEISIVGVRLHLSRGHLFIVPKQLEEHNV